MCYASLDPKHAMRDIEARLRPFHAAQQQNEQAPVPQSPGLLARLRAVLAGMKRKDARHV